MIPKKLAPAKVGVADFIGQDHAQNQCLIPKKLAPAKAGLQTLSDKIMRKISA